MSKLDVREFKYYTSPKTVTLINDPRAIFVFLLLFFFFLNKKERDHIYIYITILHFVLKLFYRTDLHQNELIITLQSEKLISIIKRY